jgi:MFS family permease
VFLAGTGVFTAASLAAGLAPSAEVLVAARAVQGVGAAALNHGYQAAFLTSAALILLLVPFHLRPRSTP